MKHLILFAVVLCIGYQPGAAQQLHFTKNGMPFTMNTQNQKVANLALQRGVRSSHQPTATDQLALYPEEIASWPVVSDGYDLFQGLRSPFDPNIWVYLERAQIGGAFRLMAIDVDSQQRTVLLQEANSNGQALAFKPIGWSKDKGLFYLEALYLDAAEAHEGLWTYDLKNNTLNKLNIPFRYMQTPLLSPDRTQFYIVSTLDKDIDYLHGNSDQLMVYDIATGHTKTMLQEKGTAINLVGWKGQTSSIKGRSVPVATARFSNLDYYLPWDAGQRQCVSRHGVPGPVGSHNHDGRCNIFRPGGHHGYAAVDFATSLSSDQNVRASASGVVSFSGISGSLTSGYGRLVIIRHSDGTRTYYAHNKVLLVSNGQSVSRGQVIALEGTTGGSTGDHIHFEWRAAGGNASTKGSFTGIGEPRQDYWYRSNNSVGTPPPSDTEAPTTSISASGGNTHSGDFTANFTDRDNVGVTRRFYQALEKYGSHWYANRGNGFFNDNFGTFYSGYTVGAGTWAASNGRLRQTNTTIDNTQLTTFLSQASGLPFLYEFSAKLISTSGPRKFGIHIMADDPTKDQRGNSYLIWFNGQNNTVTVYKTVNNVLNSRASGGVTLDNNWANYKITYSPAFGVLEVFYKNRSVLKYTDPSPISTGSSISLRTNATAIEFDDLKVYKFRPNGSQRITVGSGVTKDIRRANGKVKSLVRDAVGNWSAPGNLDVQLTFAGASAIVGNIVSQQTTEGITLFPNPTDGRSFVLAYEATQPGTATEIVLTGLAGKVLHTTQDVPRKMGKRHVDLSTALHDLPKGYYMVHVRHGGKAYSERIVKN